MSTRIQLVCALCAPVGVALILVGFWPLAGYLPPPHASDSAQEITAFYLDNTAAIRGGLFLCFLGLFVWAPLITVISQQMKRIEGAETLAQLQLVAGVTAWVFMLVPVLVLSAAAFRPDAEFPELTQALHDTGWFLLFMPVVPFVVQTISIGVAVLLDPDAAPVFPRWLGYFNLWCALLFFPGAFLTFFKTGPFAYHGLFVYWIPLLLFFVWWAAMPFFLRAAILRQAAAEGAR